MSISFTSNLKIDSKFVQLAKESPYQRFFLTGANQAKRICRNDNLCGDISLNVIEMSEKSDSFGQRQFKLALVDEGTNTQLTEPIDDGDFNYASRFKDFIVDTIAEFLNN